MFRTIGNQMMLSKRVFNSPVVRSFRGTVVTTASRALSTEAAAPKEKKPRAPKTPKEKVEKTPIDIKISDGEYATQVDLIDGIEQLTGVDKKHIHSVLAALPEVIQKYLQNDKDIRLHGIGVIKKVTRKGRNLRNMHTGEVYTTVDRDAVKITASATLKRLVKEKN